MKSRMRVFLGEPKFRFSAPRFLTLPNTVSGRTPDVTGNTRFVPAHQY
jgi:hypothetical protein